jgi:hypothetical protein
MMSRVLSALIGAWLFFSAFAFPRPPAQTALTAILGGLAIALAVGGIFDLRARYANEVFAFLLFGVSVVSLTVRGAHSTVPYWHDVVVAALILVCSALGDKHEFRAETPAEAPAR